MDHDDVTEDGMPTADPRPLAPGESDRALVLLDLTLNHFRGPEAVGDAGKIVRFVQGELRYFRERGRLVVFAHQDDADGAVVIQELTPRSDELVLQKRAPSAFFGTELDTVLRRQRVRRLTLVGLETHTSVLLTAADAMSHGYEVVVPEPCVCARDPDAHDAALRLLRTYWPASRPANWPLHAAVSAKVKRSEDDP